MSDLPSAQSNKAFHRTRNVAIIPPSWGWFGIRCAVRFSISFQSFRDNLSIEFPFCFELKIINGGFNLHPRICPHMEDKMMLCINSHKFEKPIFCIIIQVNARSGLQV